MCPDFLSPDSRLLHFKNEGDSGDIDENKGRGKTGIRCQVSGKSPKPEGRTAERARRDILSLFCLLTPVSCTSKMKVTPGIFMKTKEGENQVSGIRCQVSGARCQGKVRSPKAEPQNVLGGTFCLPTPVSCTSKMKVTPGMLMKTKERENQVSGARCQGKVRSPKAEPQNVLGGTFCLYSVF